MPIAASSLSIAKDATASKFFPLMLKGKVAFMVKTTNLKSGSILIALDIYANRRFFVVNCKRCHGIEVLPVDAERKSGLHGEDNELEKRVDLDRPRYLCQSPLLRCQLQKMPRHRSSSR